MIPVKTLPKFKCEFCKKKSVKHAMERHERICYYNPNRMCERCQNEGVEFYMNVDMASLGTYEDERPCDACKLYKQIKDSGRCTEKIENVDPADLPF